MSIDTRPAEFMQLALEQAKLAASKGEVPVGAVAVYRNQLLSLAHNEVETTNDASAHAEVLAIKRAAQALGTWRLDGVSLFVTLEPCTMCAGALVLSRVSDLYFAATDPRQGAVGSLYNLADHPSLPHQLRIFSGICAEESRQLLQQFFADRR